MLKLKQIISLSKKAKNMKQLITSINKKVNGAIINLTVNGIILLILAILIVMYNFMTRFTVGLLVLVISYVCFYLAYKIHKIKKEITKYIK